MLPFYSDCAFIKNEYEIREVIMQRETQKDIIFKICSQSIAAKHIVYTKCVDRTQQMVILRNKLTPFT